MSNYNEQLSIYQATKAGQGKLVNYRVLENGLKQRLAAGEVTKDDVAIAFDVAKRLQTNQARVMYSNIKRQAEINEASKAEETKEESGEQAD